MRGLAPGPASRVIRRPVWWVRGHQASNPAPRLGKSLLTVSYKLLRLAVQHTVGVT